MSKKDFIVKEGTVIETLPGGSFKVKVDGEDVEVVAYLSGKMRRARIYILLGDRVKMEFSKYDPNTGRIVYRTK